MKLSHLSLAVFSAIALAACGGSGNDQTTIKKDPPKDPPKEVPAGDKGPVVVSNEANATVIAAGSEAAVAASKQIYFDRNSRDLSIGYDVPNATTNMKYDDGATDAEDVLRASSIVNYVKAGWVNDDKTLRLNPLQTYVKAPDGNYYRILKPTDAAKKWDSVTSADKFTVVSTGVGAGKISAANSTKISASDLVYIPNVWARTNQDNTNIDGAKFPDSLSAAQAAKIGALANALVGVNAVNVDSISYAANPTSATDANPNTFDVSRNQVDAHTLNFAGKSYAIDSLDNDVEVDLSSIKIAQEIQTLPITFDYTVIDGKGTNSTNDDDKQKKTAQAGKALVYNLNYSRALVLLNQAAADKPYSVDAGARNVLGLNGVNGDPTGGAANQKDGEGYEGEFQVVGRETGTLPTNGRAIYDGKSFGVNSTGDIRLEADFGIDRASILGSITNRVAKTATGEKKLPDWRLQEILLSQPADYSVTGSSYFNGTSDAPDAGVYKGGSKVGTWAVQLYGANAETAAGMIFDQKASPEVIEVFNSARGDIKPKSLNN